MGNAERRLKDYVSRGEEDKAVDCYFNQIKKKVDPNLVISRPTLPPLTLLQCCALYAIDRIYWDLLNNGANVFTVTSEGDTICHLICTCDKNNRRRSIRYKMLSETIEKYYSLSVLMKCIDAKDKRGNTPLHKAAQSSLLQCVKYLVDKGCHLFAQNVKRQTACDVAGSSEVAQYLESKMVFAPSITEPGKEEPVFSAEEMPTGLTSQDILCIKDGLIVETADLLGMTLFDAEVLLRKHDWSKESLLDAWMDNPVAACENAGIQPPQAQGCHSDLVMDVIKISVDDDSVECEICLLPLDEYIVIPCDHCFCHECWKSYLHVKIEGGETTLMLCPAYGCYKFIPMDIIHNIISSKMEKKFLNFDLKAFVEGNPRLRWCPLPGCEDAVELPVDNLELAGSTALGDQNQSRDVCCGNGHFFCWGCGEQPHEPCSCEHWKEWHEKIQQSHPPSLTGGEMVSGQTADNLAWLSSHSKPCPSCKVPIQKNEGCNHMQCTKCKHDFCWMCLDPWDKHSSATGGYFDCNRYEERIRSNTMLRDKAKEAKEKALTIHQEEKFHFYYKHYINHYNNLQIEKRFTNMAAHKSEQWRQVSSGDAQFVEDAILELRRSRHALMSSYIHGYYIKRHMEREMFEELQSGVETSTELLAEIIARPHLKTPRSEIIQATKDAHMNRLKFLRRLRQGELASVEEESPTQAAASGMLDFTDDNDEMLRSSQQAAMLTLLSQFRRIASGSMSSDESLPSLSSPRLLATPPTNRVVYPPPLFSRHGNEDHREERTPFNAPTRLRRRQDSPVPMEIPTVNVPAPLLRDHPAVTVPPPEEHDDDSAFYEQLQQALTLSLIEQNPEASNPPPHQSAPKQLPPQYQPPLLQQPEEASPDHIDEDEDEIRFQAELQLVLDISRAEQESSTAEQESSTAEQEQSINHPLPFHPFISHDMGTMATGTVGVNNTAQQSSYHSDDEDDYVEIPGTHRRSPIFI